MINFENCPVTLTQNAGVFDGGSVSLFSPSISINESSSLDNLPALGLMGISGVYPSEPPNGTVNLDFYITGTENTSPFLDLRKYIYERDEDNFIDIAVGPYEIEDAVLTDYEISANVNDIITARASFNYYGQLATSTVPDQDVLSGSMVHSYISNGDFSDLGFSASPFSFNYAFSQSYEIFRTIANPLVDVALFIDGSETASVDGYGLPTGIVGSTRSSSSTAWYVPKTGGFSFELKNTCGEKLAEIGITGEFSDRSAAISDGEVVNGSIEIIKQL
tara:strand:- start:500 stop:1327 length:828 start_codon:yes stop_codon:yes gene_type:complete